MRVAFFDLEPWQVTYLQEGLVQLGLESAVEAHFSTERLTLERCPLYATVEAIAPFVWTKLDAELLEALPELRLILTMSTGYDHIDLETCRRRASPSATSHTTGRTPLPNTRSRSFWRSRAGFGLRSSGSTAPVRASPSFGDSTSTGRPWASSVPGTSGCTSSALPAALGCACWRTTSVRSRSLPRFWALRTRTWRRFCAAPISSRSTSPPRRRPTT